MRTRLPTPRTIETRAQKDKDELPPTYPKGRHCNERGCPTILGIYNPGPSCYAHAPARSRFVETVEDLRSLMEQAA